MNGGRTGAPRTRHELVETRRRLDRVRQGADLLERKRTALVNELFRAAEPAAGARTAVAGEMREAVSALLEALSVRGEAELLAAGRPSRRLEVEIRRRDLWGVTVAELGELPPVRRSPVARGTAPALTGPATERTASEFEELLEILLEVSSRELLVRRLAAAVSRTTRQLNTLEHRVAPELESSIEEARRVLEEREREEHLRIRQLLRRRGGAQTSTPRARSPV